MENFSLFARPWWVNLLIFIPLIAYFSWRGKLEMSWRTLFYAAIFGIAFGFVEAAVVIYLRSASGFLSFRNGALLNMVNFQSFYQKPEDLVKLPRILFSIELYRELATMIILASVAFLASRKSADRFGIFLWIFAFWDIFYYVFLRLTIRWPLFLTEQDILFFIPVPWYSQVWYPILVSSLLILAVIFGKRKNAA